MVYDITCFQCDSNGNCNNRQPCDGRMQYWPKKENNKLTHLTLTGLQPNTSYVLRVAAENGVSYLYGPNSNRIVEIQFGTKLSGKDRKVCLFCLFVYLFIIIYSFLVGRGGGGGAKRDVCSFIYTHISSLALYSELFNGGKKKELEPSCTRKTIHQKTVPSLLLRYSSCPDFKKCKDFFCLLVLIIKSVSSVDIKIPIGHNK